MIRSLKVQLLLLMAISLSGCGFSLRVVNQNSTASVTVSPDSKLIYSEKNTTATSSTTNLLTITDVSAAAAAAPSLLPPSITPTYSPIPITYQTWTVAHRSAATDDLKTVVDATVNRVIPTSLTSIWSGSAAVADRSCKILTGYSSTICSDLLSINIETRFLLTGAFTVGAYVLDVLSGTSTIVHGT